MIYKNNTTGIISLVQEVTKELDTTKYKEEMQKVLDALPNIELVTFHWQSFNMEDIK